MGYGTGGAVPSLSRVRNVPIAEMGAAPRERSPLPSAEIPQALLSVPVPRCQCLSLTDPSRHTASPQSLLSAC